MDWLLLSKNRVAICGTHQIGKTTLASYAAERYGRRFVREVARELLEEKGVWWNVLAQEDVANFQSAVFYTHIFLTSGPAGFIADRSVIDILAYVDYHLTEKRNKHLMGLYMEMLHWVSENLRGWYDTLLYYSPQGISLNEEQKAIDLRIVRLLNKYAPCYRTITRQDATFFMQPPTDGFSEQAINQSR